MPCVKKAKTAFAEESGRIAIMIEREIMTGTTWVLNRIPETKYNTELGHNPRSLRMQIAPPPRVEYQPLLATGNEAKLIENPLDPSTNITTTGDKQGRGCNLPAERIHWGYDEFGRCLRATALETDPMCLIDMMEKKAAPQVIAGLREKMPFYAKEHFANELLRQVVRFAQYKWSMADGMPMSVNTPNFPCVPTGGLNIGFLRNVENLIRHYGWDKGSMTPKVNGRPAIQVYAGRDSIDFAITTRKLQKGVTIQQSSPTVMDSTFGDTEVYEGIQFIENPMPSRGYVVQTGANTYEFREIQPWIIRPGVEGIVHDPNPDYHKSFIAVGGTSYVVCEIGYIIHPKAMERQAMGNVPTVDGKSVGKRFNFEVNMVPDYAIVAPECNKDGFWIQLRMLHAYAPFPFNPELMTAFLYIAATPQVIMVNPNLLTTPVTPADQPTSIKKFLPPKPEACLDCGDDTPTLRDPTSPTCTDLFPANGVGLIQWSQLVYYVNELSAGLTMVVERVGGGTGASSVVVTLTEGTATEPENFGIPSGFAGTTGVSSTFTKTLNWADGEFGIKSFTVPINDTVSVDAGKQFTAVLGTVSNSTLTAATTATVTLLENA